MGVTLAAIANNGHCSAGELLEISVFFVKAFCHLYSKTCASLRLRFFYLSAGFGWNRRLPLRPLGIERNRERAGTGDFDFAVAAHGVDELDELFGISRQFHREPVG